MLRVAITGNIASGKSQVEKYIAQEYPVYDADKLAHEVLDNIKDFYGLDVFTDGKIDRQKLAKLVFDNPDIKFKLEQLVHPKVKEKILEIFNKYSNENYVFISVPLLYETGFEVLFDKVILVTVDKNTQLKRLMHRNNLTKEEALKRIHSQLPQNDKVNKADFIIENNFDLRNLEQQVEQVLSKL